MRFLIIKLTLLLAGCLLLAINVFATTVKTDQTTLNNGIIYLAEKPFSGIVKHGNTQLIVQKGEVLEYIFLDSNDRAEFKSEVKNNQFNGKAVAQHLVLGTLNLTYSQGCLQTVAGDGFQEEWKYCQFYRGVDKGKEYRYGSKSEHLSSQNERSYNVLVVPYSLYQQPNNNGITLVSENFYTNRFIIKANGVEIKEMVYQREIGLRYETDFHHGQIIRFTALFPDDGMFMVARYQNSELSHITAFHQYNPTPVLIEKYKNDKLTEKIHLDKKISFHDSLRNIMGIIEKEREK